MSLQKKILVVEDDATMREIIDKELLSHGFRVVQAEDGKKAMDAWIKEKPDLILLDLMLPEIDGFTVLQKIREWPDKERANVPVIILSNLWSKSDVQKTSQYNIEDFMVKAYYTTQEIIERINKALKNRPD